MARKGVDLMKCFASRHRELNLSLKLPGTHTIYCGVQLVIEKQKSFSVKIASSGPCGVPRSAHW